MQLGRPERPSAVAPCSGARAKPVQVSCRQSWADDVLADLRVGVRVDVDGPESIGRNGVSAEGEPVRATIVSMNGARFVHDSLEFAGWEALIADAQRVRGLAPLAAKTDTMTTGVRSQVLATIWTDSPQCTLSVVSGDQPTRSRYWRSGIRCGRGHGSQRKRTGLRARRCCGRPSSVIPCGHETRLQDRTPKG